MYKIYSLLPVRLQKLIVENCGQQSSNPNLPWRATMKQYKTVLTIADSDSVGGGGIQADLKTILACGYFAASAITAISGPEHDWCDRYPSCAPSILEAPINAVIIDIEADSVKIGMIDSVAVIECVVKMPPSKDHFYLILVAYARMLYNVFIGA